MQARTSWLRSFVSLLALTLLLLPVAPATESLQAQIRIPPAALASNSDVSQVLQTGRRLESERRWGEALSHYEQALKDFPGRPELQQRMSLVRIHLDLGRRSSDASFIASLHEMSQREALDVYSEVLLQIHTYYVQTPNWSQLIGQGTSHLDVALNEQEFVSRHLPNADPARINAFRRQLHSTLDSQPVLSRHEARNAVALAAQMASDQLGIAPQAVVMEYTCGAISALDIYSAFLTSAQFDEVMSQIEGNFVGLGIEIKADNGSLLIVDALRGGPAYRAGIRGGDRIIEVDGKATDDISTDVAADMLKGIEGSTVDVKVLKSQGTIQLLRLRREVVEVPSVEDVKIVDREFGIGYVKVTSFQKTTLDDFDKALWNLHGQGMKSLIVDVRGNPGGLLDSAVDVADKFVSSGTIVSTRGRNPREDSDRQANYYGTWRVPLIVLIDGYSASASEIFAGAIRDHRRGTVVGQRSYGKGSVQGIFPLNVTNAGLRLTTAKFYSPSGTAISHRGVSPDVLVHTTNKPVVDASDASNRANDDAVLQAGIEAARQQVTQR